MSPEAISAIIAGVGFIVSVLTAAYIAGRNNGTTTTRINYLESNMATRDQLAGVKEDLAEIKGMFRLTIKGQDT